MDMQWVEWWMQTVSGRIDHHVTASVAWHGRFMVLAWAIFVPLAVLWARYFKVMPSQDWPRELDNKSWWHGHRWLNYAAVCLTLFGILFIVDGSLYGGVARQWHGFLGWGLVALTLVQVLGGLLRGSKGGPTAPRLADDGTVLDLAGDHYDMSRRRIVFEWVHKFTGLIALAFSLINTVLGLHLTDAPRWMWLALIVWWLVLLATVTQLQRHGKCLDTYQAIWGTDPNLPGAKVKPIGWGIRRL
jgi:hypothetical protein